MKVSYWVVLKVSLMVDVLARRRAGSMGSMKVVAMVWMTASVMVAL